MIYREKYLSEIRGFYDDDLIKIITGVRRSGKSVVLEQIREELSAKTNNIVFLDFDDRLATDDIETWQDIVRYVT
ncbi:MAG: AAA family ATPase [Clostridia bacterium]|nr:AAA family ATPase [Clostridia bacterium]